MNINFVSENKVKITLTVAVAHARPISERVTYKTSYVKDEFLKLHPDVVVKSVLEESTVKNWSEGCGEGTWVFEVEQKKPTNSPSSRATKNITFSTSNKALKNQAVKQKRK